MGITLERKFIKPEKIPNDFNWKELISVKSKEKLYTSSAAVAKAFENYNDYIFTSSEVKACFLFKSGNTFVYIYTTEEYIDQNATPILWHVVSNSNFSKTLLKSFALIPNNSSKRLLKRIYIRANSRDAGGKGSLPDGGGRENPGR